jgi:hypothetical protein
MSRDTVSDAAYARVAAHLSKDSTVVLTGTDGHSVETHVQGVLPVSSCPPTVAIALPAGSGPAMEMQRTRRVSLRMSLPEDVHVDAEVVRWIHGGGTHLLFLAEVTGLAQAA